MDSLLSEFKGWLKKPYDEDGDVISWLLFIGFLTAATFLWTRVIKRILD